MGGGAEPLQSLLIMAVLMKAFKTGN